MKNPTTSRIVSMGKNLFVFVAVALTAVCSAPPASADDFSGCESVPILGLSPSIRKICDSPMYADGSWERYRQFVSPTYVRSSCGGIYYQGGQCPIWNSGRDFVASNIGNVETYVLVADIVPPGEPGHLDNAIRCSTNMWRCE